MSVSDSKQVPKPDLDELVRGNPRVDAATLREAQALLAELRREGLIGPEYEIASPRERAPVREDHQRRRRHKR